MEEEERKEEGERSTAQLVSGDLLAMDFGECGLTVCEGGQCGGVLSTLSTLSL
jgi:hypothetical protein